MIRSWRPYFILCLCGLFITPLFHNCAQFEAQDGSVSASACSADMWPLFVDTYHHFFTVNNCKNCHAPGGVSGIPQFANPDSKKAIDVFLNFGVTAAPDMVENKLRAGHQGYSFTSFQAELSDYKKQWNEQVQSGLCTKQATTTYSQAIEFFEPHPSAPEFNIVKTSMMDWQTLTWDMGIMNSSLKGIYLSADVKVQANEFQDPENYFVRNLQIKTPDKAIRIKKIYVLLNKKTYFVTTFAGIDNVYSASPDFQPLNDGSSAGTFVKATDEKYANTDKWSIQIETFQPIE